MYHTYILYIQYNNFRLQYMELSQKLPADATQASSGSPLPRGPPPAEPPLPPGPPPAEGPPVLPAHIVNGKIYKLK